MRSFLKKFLNKIGFLSLLSCQPEAASVRPKYIAQGALGEHSSSFSQESSLQESSLQESSLQESSLQESSLQESILSSSSLEAHSCSDLEHKKGPFEESWKTKCFELGNGSACYSDCWSQKVYKWVQQEIEKKNQISQGISQKEEGGADDWQPLGENFKKAQEEIASFMAQKKYWSIDIRAIDASGKKYILFQNNATEAFIPASTNKITSSLSAHINKSYSWEKMAWWIQASNNESAESAWEAGGKTSGIKKALEALGVTAPSSWKNIDGSGLSYSNQVTSQFLVDILLAIQKKSWYSSFYKALPKSCSSGTLASQFCSGLHQEVSIYAKTGTLNTYKGVKALAGYGITQGKGTLIFSVIYNGPAGTAHTIGSPQIQKIVSRAAETLVYIK